jgi:predicted dinucleotide-binding enzyme
MKIGVIGSGVVGQALGKGFIEHGYEVMLGTRSPDKLSDWKKKAGKGAGVGTVAETARFGDIVVLAAKGTAAADALSLAGAENLAGKTVIDATNPISDSPPDNGVLSFFTSYDRSLMEQLQSDFPDAHFVKAFSCIGNSLMVNPDFGGVKPTMFICGDHEVAKRDTREILELFGFEVEDMGGAQAARAIEPLCILWCIPGLLRNEWTHAFKLLKA